MFSMTRTSSSAAMSRLRIIAIALFIFGISARGALAAPIFVQTPIVNAGENSDVDSAFRTADDFTIATDATITSVQWRGMECCDNTPLIIDLFTLNFYSANGSVPGALLSSYAVGNAVNRTASGQLFGNTPVFDYSADLGAGFHATA